MAFLTEHTENSHVNASGKNHKGSPGGVVSFVEDTNDKWMAAEQSNRDRQFENLMAFYDIDGGAWPDADLAELRRQGRHPTSYNIAEQKLNTLAGSIQAEKFDYDFLPLNLQESTLTKGIKHWYYADKEQYNYSYSENKTLTRGLIHSGDEEMEIKFDIRDTGAISFTPQLPGVVLKDPYWLSDDLKDWKRAIKHAYMLPSEMLKHFDSNDHAIETLARQDDIGGEWYEPRQNVNDLKKLPAQWGSQVQVIEYRWLEEVKTTRLYGRLPIGRWIPFPLDINESEVRKLKSFFGIESFEDIKEFPYEDSVLRYHVIAPSATSKPIIEDEVHPVQCGFIGFFRFSAAKEMGIEKGVMEAMLDLQRTLNYRESKKDDVIASAGVGALAVNVDALQNGETDLAKIRQNKTKPDFVLPVNGDPNKIFGRFPTGEVPQSIWNDINNIVQMFDRVTPVTPALEGSGPSDESGILFEMRHAVTKLGTLMLYDNWQNYLTWKAEAWYNQAQRTYKHLYQKIKRTDEPGFIEFNKPNGDGTYLNSVDMLPRSKIIVTLSKVSPTQQMATRVMLFDMAKMMSANPQLVKPQLRVTLNKLIETLELSPEERQNYKVLGKMQEQSDFLEIFANWENLMNSAAQAKVGQAQAAVILKQLQGQMQQALQPQTEAPEAVSQPTLPLPQGGGELEMATQGSPDSPGQSIETFRGPFQP